MKTVLIQRVGYERGWLDMIGVEITLAEPGEGVPIEQARYLAYAPVWAVWLYREITGRGRDTRDYAAAASKATDPELGYAVQAMIDADQPWHEIIKFLEEAPLDGLKIETGSTQRKDTPCPLSESNSRSAR